MFGKMTEDMLADDRAGFSGIDLNFRVMGHR